MRKKFSFKGIILGALVDVGGSNVWGIIAVTYIVMHYQMYRLPAAQMSSKMQYFLLHDSLIFTLNLIIGSAFSVLGGYVAARIAKQNKLLNATLSSFLCEISSLSAIGSPLAPLWTVLVSLIANPLLNLAGGYIRLWEEKKKNSHHSKK